MFARSFILLAFCTALGACDRHEPVKTGVIGAPAPQEAERKTVSTAPEHFDRVRAEQFESEEDRISKRNRPN